MKLYKGAGFDFIAVICIAAFIFNKHNRVFNGKYRRRLTPETENLITRRQPNIVLKKVLLNYREELGRDYSPYYCHCLRVLNFAIYFMDKDGNNAMGESRDRNIDVMAFALAYHDIGLWTDKELSYLEPSVTVMERDLQVSSIREMFDPPLTEEEIIIAREIILQHHKITSYSVSKNNIHDTIGNKGEIMINAVRKGDWVDATMGIIKHGISTDLLETAYFEIPHYGFHNMLLGMGKRLSPDSIMGQFRVLKILKL